MYVMTARKDLTYGDGQFLRETGIDPCLLDDPFPRPLPPPLPPESLIPSLTGKDACWLLNLGVMWEQEPEPDFIPPKSLREYLVQYLTSIRKAVGYVALELGLAPSDDGLDALVQKITQMFLRFVAADLEDVVAMYAFHRSLRLGGFSFPDYMRFRVKACVETVLQNRMTSTENSGDSLRQKPNQDDCRR
jgi:hypothetical protein